MRVLLISANTLTVPYPVYPIGLDYVAGALTSAHEVRILDMNCAGFEDLKSVIDEFLPELVGISLRNIDNTDTTDPQEFMEGYRRLAETVRTHCRAPIVLGGAGFSIFPEKILDTLAADYGIVGEGDHMAALLDALAAGGSAVGLPGVVTPERDPDPAVPATRGPRRQFDNRSVHLDFYLRHGGMLNLQTKRGCPFRCIYCTYPHIEGRRMRLMEPSSVADTAKALEDAGARYFFIVDSAFNADIEHSLAVAEQFRNRGVSIPWGAFLAPLRMPDAYFDTLARCGLTHVEFGTESLSDRVLRAYGKPFHRQWVLDAHEQARKAGLRIAHYFLLGGPEETAETLETTLSHIDKLKKSVLFLFCGMRIYPRTPLYDRALEEGLIGPEKDLLTPFYYESPAIGRDAIITRVKDKAEGRVNWVVGSGGDEAGELVKRMYRKGYTGPLWEFLIR
ncbi:MAG: lipid biosynthesis B12-binding/radical SAM protein [Desulfosarcinaceae bacterium]